MDIQALISNKSDQDRVRLDGVDLPVGALRRLLKDGYEQVRVYEADGTFSVWGKSCTACFTKKQIEQVAAGD
ncbi:MAG: hypothetical protein JW821_06740 [Deltaproteobacteria bacterium]|nr:hypothetical protein [Deltaproteobacteria bacterium]